MTRNREPSIDHFLRIVLPPVLCGAGLLGGLTIGGVIIYFSGLWNQFDRVVGMSLNFLTILDLITAIAPFVIVIGCGWLGARGGMALLAKVEFLFR